MELMQKHYIIGYSLGKSFKRRFEEFEEFKITVWWKGFFYK